MAMPDRALVPVRSGFPVAPYGAVPVTVLGDAVTVLANRAVPSAQLDAAVAREQLVSALARPATTPEAVARRAGGR